MAKHLIEDIKVGLSDGGVACGPAPYCVVTEMKLRNMEDNSVIFYGITEVDGVENFLKSEESFYDTQINDDFEDVEAWDKVYAAQTTDYDENDPIWRLLDFFVEADWDAVEDMKPKCIGKFLDEIEIPKSDEE